MLFKQVKEDNKIIEEIDLSEAEKNRVDYSENFINDDLGEQKSNKP
jgi:hypothetical protein